MEAVMTSILRPRLAIALVAALGIAACGGGNPTTAPTGQQPGTTLPGATDGPAATAGLGGELEGLAAELLAPVFGATIPTPTCTDMSGGRQCRWIVGDGELLVDADVQSDFATEEEWRTAFGDAGFEEEIPGVGVAALGGDNPLADGWRATAYTSDGLAYSVTVNKPGDEAEAKAIVIAILTALAS
jgi:hypothetical protein